MSKQAESKPERRKAWAKAKSAVGAYARNPCAATEVSVSAAVEGLRHQSNLEAIAEATTNPGEESTRSSATD